MSFSWFRDKFGRSPYQDVWWDMPAPSPAPAPAPAPTIPPPVSLDPVEIANATYGKIIPIFVGGKARIGCNFISGPHYSTVGSARTASFGVSFGFPADPNGNRRIEEINFDSRLAWSLADGFAAESFTYRFYQGRYDQAIDAIETANWGVDAHSYAPQMVLFLENLPLTPFGNKIPYVSAMIGDITGGADPDDGINLGDALERVAHSPWVGYTEEEFVTQGIVDVIPAMIFDRDISFLDLLKNLQRIYRNLDILQTDVLRVRDRGNTGADRTFDLNHIVEQENGGAIQFSREGPANVARELELVTIDPDADYVLLPSTAKRPRDPVVVSASIGKETISLPLVLDAPTRLSMVTYAKYYDEQARKRVQFTSMAYGLEVEPGDLVELTAPATGFEDETFRVIETLHGTNWTVGITAEALLKCAMPFTGTGEVVLLLHFNGADGATEAVDSSSYAHEVTFFHWTGVSPSQGPVIDTAQSVFGGASMYNALSGSFPALRYVRVDTSGDRFMLDPDGGGGNPWTVELRVRFESFDDNVVIIGCSAGSFSTTSVSSPALSLNTWYSVIVDRATDNTIRMYIDGVMVDKDITHPLDAVTAWKIQRFGNELHFAYENYVWAGGPIYIGGEGGIHSNAIEGWIDEVRVTVGISQYGDVHGDSTFTPPLAEF